MCCAVLLCWQAVVVDQWSGRRAGEERCNVVTVAPSWIGSCCNARNVVLCTQVCLAAVQVRMYVCVRAMASNYLELYEVALQTQLHGWGIINQRQLQDGVKSSTIKAAGDTLHMAVIHDHARDVLYIHRHQSTRQATVTVPSPLRIRNRHSARGPLPSFHNKYNNNPVQHRDP